MQATRPYFYLSDGQVKEQSVTFPWYGIDPAQKKQSALAMHEKLKEKGYTPLEISTKSDSALGKKLSAFSLKLGGKPLESVFQASKKFRNGGPYLDIQNKKPWEAKKDSRLRSSGALTAFEKDGEVWGLNTQTAFYDYLYYQSVKESLSESELASLASHDAFTDIEFNPQRSFNTQARSVGLVVLAYQEHGCLPDYGKEDFLEFQQRAIIYRQPKRSEQAKTLFSDEGKIPDEGSAFV